MNSPSPAALKNARCADIMQPAACIVDPDFTCERTFQSMAATRSRFAAVVVDGALAGLVTIGDFARLRGRDPASLFLGAIMTPAKDLITLAPQTIALDALRALDESHVHQMPVLSAGRKLEGFITRETLMSLGAWDE
ncbi:MAG TPA: CBS domain-containing protein [Candidatus Baltobacteraceae bacterium]|jgi:CBS domain-containing protein|nr:CBS domain-containing protein [Candidatus Baltobacteraceae bacterium]